MDPNGASNGGEQRRLHPHSLPFRLHIKVTNRATSAGTASRKPAAQVRTAPYSTSVNPGRHRLGDRWKLIAGVP